MGKQLIDIIGEFVEISGNSTVDGILFFVIGIVSFSVAFGLVGKIFDALGFYDSDLMSDVHWLIRLVVFGGLTYICVKIAQLVTWLFSFQWWVYVIAVAIIIAVIFIAYWLRYKHQIHKYQNVINSEDKYHVVDFNHIETTENRINNIEIEQENANNRYYCPRCNSKLVKRHGPYGDFYGCESYGKTGCRYTRKYL